MALELKLEYILNNTVDKLVIKDKTGSYSVLNEGGWGAPNTERNAIALVCYLRYQPYSGTETKSLLIQYDTTFLNTFSSEFEFDYTLDGWYKAALVSIPLTVNTPAENRIRFNTSEERLEIYKSAEWTELLETDFDNLLNETNEKTDTQEILMGKLIQQRNCMLEEYIRCINCETCKCETTKEELTKLNLLIQATDYRFHSQKEFEAQKMVERLTKQFKCCK